MRYVIALAISVLLFVAANQAVAGPIAPAMFSRADGAPPIILVQDKPAKDDTLKQRVKRAWRELTGYRFDVNCPINYHRTCTETGKDRAEARNKCIARNAFCWVADAK